MKKTLKAFIASILILTMLFGTVSASAVELIPAGSELNAGFIPEETGYYISKIEITQNEELLNSVTVKKDGGDAYLYYLYTKESYSANEVYPPEFVGAEIESVSAADPSAFDNLILGVDVEEGANSFILNTSAVIEFANGRTEYATTVPFVCDGGVVAGENEVMFDIPVYDGESITITACALEDVIRTVELKNESNSAIAYLDYKGNIFFSDLDEKVIVINDAQEIVTNEYGYFVYSSRNYPILIGSEIIEGEPVKIKIFISGNAGDVEIASFNCNVREAYYTQNLTRALGYYEEELLDVIDEIFEKYKSMPSFLYALLEPIMMAEYVVKAIPLYFRFLSEIIDLYVDFVNDLL